MDSFKFCPSQLDEKVWKANERAGYLLLGNRLCFVLYALRVGSGERARGVATQRRAALRERIRPRRTWLATVVQASK